MNFSRPGQIQRVWQWLEIETYWEHHNRPPGQRFLGSFRVGRDASKQLIDIAAQNLGRVRPLTFHRLCQDFDTSDPERYWIRIITLALSEYAYYDECDAGFWQGLCDRLRLDNTQGVQNTLREIVQEGSESLGLVVIRDTRNLSRVRCVSTLYLQSGIPQRNIEHFSRLLQELSEQYDWWDIAHADPDDLSQLLYDFCHQYHPQWGRLLRFLRLDSDGEIQSISGEILKGLAIVAQALERQGLDPTVLQDDHQREQLLQDFCLPSTFFLRSWDDLIQVLTPHQQNSRNRRQITSLRKKPLLLMLDVVDSMDIQLVLSAQTLWQSDWQNLRGTYAQIQEYGWETTLPRDGVLEIPELPGPIDNIAQEWVWHLRSHTRKSLTEWRCQGVDQDFPILIFDAWTGDRLLSSNGLHGKLEIICFCDRTVQLELSDTIEIIDSFVPCSISGWRGQQLQLIGEQSQLTFRIGEFFHVIDWHQTQSAYPQLRGLKLKCKELTYLEVPSIWYPPINLSQEVNIEIEDLERREVLTAVHESVNLSGNSGWQPIRLSQWIGIDASGSYMVKLWSGDERWSERFILQSSFALDQLIQNSSIQVCDRANRPIHPPERISSSLEFWLTELALRNLWPLEEVKFLLSNGQAEHSFVRQASMSGVLSLNLAALRDVLPESDEYYFSYQRSGEECCVLIERSTRELGTDIREQQQQVTHAPDPPTPSLPIPRQLIYSLKIKNDTLVIRKAFVKKFSDRLKKANLGQSIQLIRDPILRELLRVQIEDQECLLTLRTILTDLESTLHTSIELIPWEQ